MVETSFPELEMTPAQRRAQADSQGARPGLLTASSAYRVAIYTILIVAAFISLLPFGYVVSTSFKSTMALFAYPPDWLPDQPTLDNYRNLLHRYPFWRWLLNSFIVAGSVTAIKLVFDSMAGYAFAKMRFPGREALFLVVLISLMVPFASLLIPTFIIIRELGMLNTYWGLILPGLASPIGVFMMRQFIESLPSDLENAARLDGCSEFQIYRKVILPLIKPGLVVLGVFTFMVQWTSYLWPLVVVTKPEMATLTVGARSLTSTFTQDWGLNSAAAILSMLPMIIVFIFLQRYFIAGSIAGALKE
ncbi:MAG: carbohydrate ABC transporter permease [Thermomicrobiales bacterium]|nr:carbohydrate ABC transporter permease [Thermomicrobiales bacterium]